jgi:DNA-binding IclR family transcriptional regulator
MKIRRGKGSREGNRLSNIQSLERALNIINILAYSEKPVGVTEIGKLLGIHKSTAYRLILTLRQFGYVEQDEETERYYLGLKPLELSNIILERLDIRKIAHPYLEELSGRVNETVHLAVREEDEIVYIDKVESKQAIRMYSRVGARAPLYCTALGKCLLAFGPQELIEKWIFKKELPPRTESTIKTGEELQKELMEIKRLGYALDREEFEQGVKCIGVPILNKSERAIAAISISIPAFRVTEEKIQDFIPILLETGEKISKRLKFL